GEPRDGTAPFAISPAHGSAWTGVVVLPPVETVGRDLVDRLDTLLKDVPQLADIARTGETAAQANDGNWLLQCRPVGNLCRGEFRSARACNAAGLGYRPGLRAFIGSCHRNAMLGQEVAGQPLQCRMAEENRRADLQS